MYTHGFITLYFFSFKSVDPHVATLLGMTLVYLVIARRQPWQSLTRHCEGIRPWQSLTRHCEGIRPWQSLTRHCEGIRPWQSSAVLYPTFQPHITHTNIRIILLTIKFLSNYF
jgi:uncharacterized protein VirK/YbjX